MTKRIRSIVAVAGVVLLAVGGLVAVAQTAGPSAGPPMLPFKIVAGGQPAATIVVAADATAPVREAAERLAAFIEQSSGAKLAVAAEPVADTATIFVGPSPQVAGFRLDQRALDCDDGFDIAYPARNTVAILGRGDTGTEFGVQEFLERYVGVRWLMPGPFGTEVPEQKTITLPGKPVRQNPSFATRYLLEQYGPRHPGYLAKEWARRNRMQQRMPGEQHYLNILFKWEDFQTHPEFFPLVRGTMRFTPKGMQGWQPCFNPEVTGATAIERINAYFDQNPDAPSFNLAVNDNGQYCRCAYCQPKMQGQDYSDVYYPWVNYVISGVLSNHPGKTFGGLAHNNVRNAPRGNLHPSFVPYVTRDLHKWIHPAVRREMEANTRGWMATGVKELAWYDYAYGEAYLLPRVYFHAQAEALRFGRANGVRHYYAEAYPNFGEGPKLYVLLKLLWNVNGDVDAYLNEWYEGVGGKDAAPFLQKYYAAWESFWTKRILELPWFIQAGTYMPFYSEPSYLLGIKEQELAFLREQLTSALDKAQTPAQKQRVQTLLDAFAFYEASALAYQAGTPRTIGNRQGALDAVARALRAAELGRTRRDLVTNVLPKNPMHAMLKGGDGTMRFLEDRGVFDQFWAAAKWAVSNRVAGVPVLQRLGEIQAQQGASDLGYYAKAAVAVAQDPAKTLVEEARNGGFEDPFRGDPASFRPKPNTGGDEFADIPHWYVWIAEYAKGTEVRWVRSDLPPASTLKPAAPRRTSAAAAATVTEEAYEGASSLRFGPGHAAVQQHYAVEAGTAYLVSVALKARLRDETGSGGLTIKGAGPLSQLNVAPGTTTDGWVTRQSSLLRIREAGTLTVLAGLHSSDPEDYLYVDAIRVQKVVVDAAAAP